MEHIEEAGIHSGDSACACRPTRCQPTTVEAIKTQARALARELGVRRPDERAVRGPARRRGLHPRGQPARLAHGAVRVEGDRRAAGQDRGARDGRPHARRSWASREVDAARTSRSRRRCSRSSSSPASTRCSGPEMRSTGEVMGIDRDFPTRVRQGQIGAGTRLPHRRGTVFLSRAATTTSRARSPSPRGSSSSASASSPRTGTHDFLGEHGIEVERVNKVREGRPHCVDRILDGDIQLVINTTSGAAGDQGFVPDPPHRADQGRAVLHDALGGARRGRRASPSCARASMRRALAAGVPEEGEPSWPSSR